MKMEYYLSVQCAVFQHVYTHFSYIRNSTLLSILWFGDNIDWLTPPFWMLSVMTLAKQSNDTLTHPPLPMLMENSKLIQGIQTGRSRDPTFYPSICPSIHHYINKSIYQSMHQIYLYYLAIYMVDVWMRLRQGLRGLILLLHLAGWGHEHCSSSSHRLTWMET